MSVSHKPVQSRKPLPLDRQTIEDKALRYLDRFDASASRLRRVLEQFVRQRAAALGIDPGPPLTIVSETVERYQQSGLVDDRRFSAAMARTLAERGASRQTIKSKLFGRGVATDVIDEVVMALGQDVGSELDAARTLVRKRKLGRYRSADAQRANYRRDLGILARAGFSFEIAKTALSVEGADDEEF